MSQILPAPSLEPGSRLSDMPLVDNPPGTGPGSSKSLGDDWLRYIQGVIRQTIGIEHDLDSGKNIPGTARLLKVADLASLPTNDNTADGRGRIGVTLDNGQVYWDTGTVWQLFPTTPIGGALASVSHDSTLIGDGTVAVPLEVDKLQESGGAFLTIGSIPVDSFVKRSGTSLVGSASTVSVQATTIGGDGSVGNPLKVVGLNTIAPSAASLTMGSVLEGQLLKRVGTTVVGSSGSGFTVVGDVEVPAGPGQTSISVTAIPASKTLQVFASWGTLSGAGDYVGLRFNNDSGASYNYKTGTSNQTGQAYLKIHDQNGNTQGSSAIDIANPTVGDKMLTGDTIRGTPGGILRIQDGLAGIWIGVAQINRIDLVTDGGVVLFPPGSFLRVLAL